MEQTSEQKAERTRRVTEAVLSLPVLPTVTAKLLELVDNPRVNSAVLANLLAKDQVLTAKVLKVANSSYYGFVRTIPTVREAVPVLGMNSLREICISMSIFNMFKKEMGNKYFDVSDFWKHSIAVGLGARMLMERAFPALAAEAFTAGLLHDIGKMVLSQYLPFEFYQLQKKVFEEQYTLPAAEIEVLGVEHAKIGGWLAGRWNLPEALALAIMKHHDPWEAETHSNVCFAVYFADQLAFEGKLGNSGIRLAEKVPEYFRGKIFEMFKLDDEALPAFRAELALATEEKSGDLLAEMA